MRSMVCNRTNCGFWDRRDGIDVHYKKNKYKIIMDRDFLHNIYVVSTMAIISGCVLAALDVTDWRLAIIIVGFLYWVFSIVAVLIKKD